MGEEFYCILKLVSGEEIISLISLDDENNDDPLIILQNPIMIKIVEGPAGLMIKVKPWMELCEDDIYFIRMSKVMTMTETRDKNIIDIYEDYIKGDSTEDIFDSHSSKVKPSTKMGYVSSVEEARKSLENIFNSDSKEIKDI